MLLVTKHTRWWRVSPWLKVLIRASEEILCICSLFDCWWLGKECLYGLRWEQEPSTASLGGAAQWENSRCCFWGCHGRSSCDRAAKTLGPLKGCHGAVCRENTKKHGEKERRGSCTYVTEDTKNKEVRRWRRWGNWGYKQIYHMKKLKNTKTVRGKRKIT